MEMLLERYRFISGRRLLQLGKLGRCQALPEDTWTPVAQLWHGVFVSHRWGQPADPDPMGTQLVALQQLVGRMVEIRAVLEDERVSPAAVRDRLARVPGLGRQGSLQAAHLVFRTLCGGGALEEAEAQRLLAGDGILDLIGFWYDFSCLPQEPRTGVEEQEFRQALLGIEALLTSEAVSTLVLRRQGDGYMARGWCVGESMLAGAKADVFKPMILPTDRWDMPLDRSVYGTFGELQPEIERLLGQWEDVANPVGAQAAFGSAVNGTALLLLAKVDGSMSAFVVAAAAGTALGGELFAQIQSRIALLPMGGCLEVAAALVEILQGQGMGCRDGRDYSVVGLLILQSMVDEEATGELAIWRGAIARLTAELPLRLVRRAGGVEWVDGR